ncbi:MAG: ABC transporter permease [Rhodoglobus sp.]|jgi:peptide/nickel transport system permease protein|nr:ABC transporter permease [Rhodoglobus sp.]
MLEYAIRRILAAVPLLFGLTLLVFIYVRLIPGDPVVAMLGVASDPELVARLREELGLNEPWYTQYFTWLAGVAQGDLGTAFRSGAPIAEILVGRIPASLELALAGLIVTLAIAIPAGVAAGMKPGSLLDRVVSGGTLFGLAVPAFWLGAILVMVFAVWLRWVPSSGYVPFAKDPGRNLELLILPALTLGLALSPYLARLTRATVLEIRGETFVGFGRAQGLPGVVIARDLVLRNAAPSLVVAIGVTVGGLLAGSVVVETLFNWPGMGRLIVVAVGERDYSLIQALLLVYGVIFIVVNLIAELAQGLLDPRIRL